MTSPLCVATGGWWRRVFHYRPPTPMYRNSPPLCTIVLQIPSLMPLKMRKVQVEDRVVMPFNAACGFCENCQRGFTGFCTTVNPGFAGGAYGYVAMGPSRGGRAEYLQVPFRYRPGVGSGDKGCSGRPDGNDPSAAGSHNIGAFLGIGGTPLASRSRDTLTTTKNSWRPVVGPATR